MRRTVLCNEELGFTTTENRQTPEKNFQQNAYPMAAVDQISRDRQSPFFEFNIP